MHNILQILKMNRHLWRYYAGLMTLTMFVSVLAMSEPFWLKQIIDELSTKLASQAPVDVQRVLFFTGLIFVSYLLYTILNNIQGYIGDQMAIRLKRHLSERYYDQLLRLPQSYFDNEMSGSIINRLSRSIDSLSRFVNMSANNFIGMFLSVGIGLTIIALIAWPSAVMLAALFPIYVLLTRKTSGKWQKIEKRKNRHGDKALGRFSETISQVKVVRAYMQENREYSFFSKQYGRIVNLTQAQSRLWHIDDVRRKLVVDTIFFGATAFVVSRAASGQISIGEMVLVIQYAFTMRFPINMMSFLVDNYQQAVVGSDDYLKTMALKPETKLLGGTTQSPRFQEASLQFNDVRFSYESGSEVLRGVDMTIAAGSKVALVGESGEGKTTITNLILKLYKPDSGSILINGNSYDTLSFEDIRSNVAVVFQEPALFSGTIRDNIAYGNPAADEESVIKAAKAANAHSFISALPDSYESEIGERGVKLSGGQKQRIAIARAILKDAPLLLLDEATSSLDSKSETLVQQALERLMHNRTTIIIAHRLSTIQNVDQIITLRNGKVDEIGSPKDLAHSGGIYAELLDLQRQLAKGDTKEIFKKYDLAG